MKPPVDEALLPGDLWSNEPRGRRGLRTWYVVPNRHHWKSISGFPNYTGVRYGVLALLLFASGGED